MKVFQGWFHVPHRNSKKIFHEFSKIVTIFAYNCIILMGSMMPSEKGVKICLPKQVLQKDLIHL